MKPLDDYIKKQLDEHLRSIENLLDADALTIISPLLSPLDSRIRTVLDNLSDRKKRLTIIIETDGGVIEVCERIVQTIRHFYREVYFLVPNKAMSAGTVFVMSGDKIFMDHFSCLGPIDPQIIRNDGSTIPALSYLNQFERLVEKSQQGELTTAEFALLNKLDLGELYQFEQARELSIELLEKWLSSYKFKKWKKTETRKKRVTPQMRKERAYEIGEELSNMERWHTHGRGIDMKTLQDELNLKIDDFSSVIGLDKEIRSYSDLVQDYKEREQYLLLLHTREEIYGWSLSQRSAP